MKKIILSLGICLSLVVRAQVSNKDIRKADKIQKDLASQCRQYRAKYSFEETRKRLIEDAKKYKDLKFQWDKDQSTPSMIYRGLPLIIMPAECQAPGEPPAARIQQGN